MENRRDFLQRTVFGLAAVGLARPAFAGEPAAAPLVVADSAHWLLAPLHVGDEVGLGWKLARVFPATQGAVTINLAHADGRVARIDMCLLDRAARGPAQSRFVDFIVMDGGDGDAPMTESLGRVVRKLAAIVAANEVRDIEALSELEPHADRVWKHEAAMSQASVRLAPGVG